MGSKASTNGGINNDKKERAGEPALSKPSYMGLFLVTA